MELPDPEHTTGLTSLLIVKTMPVDRVESLFVFSVKGKDHLHLLNEQLPTTKVGPTTKAIFDTGLDLVE